jgi:hypothetical protein
MSVIFTLILVTSMPIVRIPMEAMNASAGVVTVAMESYAMVLLLYYYDHSVQYP